MTRADSADFRMLYDDLSTDGWRLVADVATQLGTHLGEVRRATNARILVELPELARARDELRDGLDRSTDAHVRTMRTAPAIVQPSCSTRRDRGVGARGLCGLRGPYAVYTSQCDGVQVRTLPDCTGHNGALKKSHNGP